MKAVSVGFLPIEWSFNEERGGYMPMDFKRQELVEISAVPVPSNPDALSIARSKGIDTASIVAWAETVGDDDTGLWVPKEAIESLLKQAAGDKTFSIPPPAPDPDPEPAPSSTKPGETTVETELSPAVAYQKTVEAAEAAEAEIVDSICKAIDAIGARASLGSAGTAKRLADAVAKASALLTTKTPAQPAAEPVDPATAPADPDGNGAPATITVDQFKAMADELTDKILAKHTGRLPY